MSKRLACGVKESVANSVKQSSARSMEYSVEYRSLVLYCP